jgi:putative ABC transport system substrate-binding protein
MRVLLFAIALAIASGLPALAADLLILQSSRTPQLNRVARLVQNSCGTDHRTLALDDYTEVDLSRIVREERPGAVLALGDRAFTLSRLLQRPPSLFSMVLNGNEEQMPSSMGGVSMMVSPKRYMKLFSGLSLKRVGLLYDKQKSGGYVRRARQQAEKTGIELIALPIQSPREIPQMLAELKRRKPDVLWLIPDTTVVTAETVDGFFVFSQDNRLPVVAFSSGYLRKGALAVLDITPHDVARQICTSLVRLREDGSGSGVTDIDAGNPIFNESVAARLGINTSKFAP